MNSNRGSIAIEKIKSEIERLQQEYLRKVQNQQQNNFEFSPQFDTLIESPTRLIKKVVKKKGKKKAQKPQAILPATVQDPQMHRFVSNLSPDSLKHHPKLLQSPPPSHPQDDLKPQRLTLLQQLGADNNNLISIRNSYSPQGLQNKFQASQKHLGLNQADCQQLIKKVNNHNSKRHTMIIPKTKIKEKLVAMQTNTRRMSQGGSKDGEGMKKKKGGSAASARQAVQVKQQTQEIKQSDTMEFMIEKGIAKCEEKLLSKFDEFLQNFQRTQQIPQVIQAQAEVIQTDLFNYEPYPQQVQDFYQMNQVPNQNLEASPTYNNLNQVTGNDELTTFLSPDNEGGVCLTSSDSRGAIMTSQKYLNHLQPNQTQQQQHILYCDSPLRPQIDQHQEEDFPLRQSLGPLDNQEELPQTQDDQGYVSTSLIILEPVTQDHYSNISHKGLHVAIKDCSENIILLDKLNHQSSSSSSSLIPVNIDPLILCIENDNLDEQLSNDNNVTQQEVEESKDREVIIEKQEKQEEVRQEVNNKHRLDLSQLSEEFKKEQKDEDQQSDSSIEMYAPQKKQMTGHQKYRESRPNRKPSISHNSLLRSIRPQQTQKPPLILSDLSTSIFDRNSFQLFQTKTLVALKAESQLTKLLSQLNQALDLKLARQNPKLTLPSTLDIKKHKNHQHRQQPPLELWVTRQREEIQQVQRHLMQGCARLVDMIEHVMREKSILDNSDFITRRGVGTADKTQIVKIWQQYPRLDDVRKGSNGKKEASRSMMVKQTEIVELDVVESSKEKENMKVNEVMEESQGPKDVVQIEEIKIEINDLKTPEVTRKKGLEMVTNSSNADSGNISVSSCEQIEPMNTNRAILFNDSLDQDTCLKIASLQITEGSLRSTTPTKFESKNIKLEKSSDEISIPENPNRIQTGVKEVQDYIKQVYDWVFQDSALQESIIDIVCQPFQKDSKMILAHMQNPEILYGSKSVLDYQLPNFELPFQPPILPVDLYLTIEKDKLFPGLLQSSQDSQSTPLSPPTNISFSVELQNIHNKAIFDGLNEALDNLRPYGLRGPPVPWSKQPKTLTFRYASVLQLRDLLSDARTRVLTWQANQAGTIRGSQRERTREERLSKMLVQEIEETDRQWADFEMEETQIKLDLTDVIMSQIVQETVEMIEKMQQRSQIVEMIE